MTVSIEVLSPVLLPCNVVPDESHTLSWSKDGETLVLPFPGFQQLENGSLFIQSVAQSQEGEYTCTASNLAGSSQGTVELIVEGNFEYTNTRTHTHTLTQTHTNR